MKSVTQINREAWNEISVRHRQQNGDTWTKILVQPCASVLDSLVSARLRALMIEGRSVAQLCSNNGREIISLKNMGAGRCVGFDISDEAIGQANELAHAASVECEFVRTDLYDISSDFDQAFDLIFMSAGTLGWMPDLKSAFGVVARLLRPGGRFLIYEMHPVLDMFDSATDNPIEVLHSYWKTDPYVGEGLDYLGDGSYKCPTAEHWFHHTLGGIFGAIFENGMLVEAFTEYDHDISEIFGKLAAWPKKPPMCCILQGQRTTVPPQKFEE